MSETQSTENSDEMDLWQLFKLLKNFLKTLLLGFFNFLFFLKKKAIILIGVIVIGIILGGIWDHFLPNKSYVQEIIIEPNYGNTVLIYDLIDEFDRDIKKGNLDKNLALEKKEVDKLANIRIEPIVDYSDILNFHKEMGYGDNAFNVLGDLGSDLNETSEKYRRHFRFHKMQLCFNDKFESAEKISTVLLDFIKSNPYFLNKRNSFNEELKNEIEENKKSISFINNYVAKISSNKSIEQGKDVLVLGNEKEIPTVASLIREKNNLMEEVALSKKNLEMHSEVLNIVHLGKVLEKSNLLRVKKVLIPLFLLVCSLGLYLFRFLYDIAVRFTNT